jgi:PAS domain S-box-containing protein
MANTRLPNERKHGPSGSRGQPRRSTKRNANGIVDEQFRLALEATPAAMIMVDRTGHLVFINALAETLFGYTRQEVVGRPIEMLVPERYRSRHPDLRNAFLASPSPRAMGAGRELYALRKDGREIPVEIGLNPFKTGQGGFILASVVDITERKRAEDRLRLTLEAAPVAILMVDRQGIIASMNAQAERILGYVRVELLGRAVETLVPERFRTRHPEHRGGFFTNPSPRSMGAGRELYALRKDGREVPVEIGLSPVTTEQGIFVLASIIDITERKATDDARRELLKTVNETAQNVASAAAEILATSTQQASGAQEQAAAVAQTVTTVDEVMQTSDQAAQRAKVVAESAQRTVESSRTGRKAVDEAVKVMGAVKEQVEALAESILTLAEQAQQIGEIIATVNEIAEQTNLLALNAAIEAARAGDQGKGFAVVASEVKALAEQSKKATAQVRQILGDIQKATNAAVMATEDGTKGVNGAIKVVDQAGESIRTLADTINETAQASSLIAASATQQAIGMAQIHQAMRNINQVTNQSLASTKQAERAAQDLDTLGTKLRSVLGNYGG